MPRNHNYKTPKKGSENWHVPLNENFEQLDSDVEIRADETNLKEYEPKDGAKYLATDTGTIYIGNGTEWREIGTINGSQIETDSVSGIEYVVNHAGPDLSAKIKNALEALPNGQGIVRVTPPKDGTAWKWDQPLTINPLRYHGVELHIGRNVEINCDVTEEYILTINTRGRFTEDVHNRVWIHGGSWRKASGANPSGWLRIIDAIRCVIHPERVEMRNETGDCTGVSIENHTQYAELNEIYGMYRVDRGIDYVPASVTGGSGTDSFHNNHIERAFIQCTDFGIRLRGGYQYCQINHPAIFLQEEGARGIILDSARMDGSSINAAKIEMADVVLSDLAAFKTTDSYDYFYCPLIVGGLFDLGDNPNVDAAAPTDRVPYLQVRGQGIGIYDLHHESRIALDPAYNGVRTSNGDFETQHDGRGMIVPTPDGTNRYRIRVDNDGNVVSDHI